MLGKCKAKGCGKIIYECEAQHGFCKECVERLGDGYTTVLHVLEERKMLLTNEMRDEIQSHLVNGMTPNEIMERAIFGDWEINDFGYLI